jgi:hypothetical protein
METKINIAAILKDKPQGTKLYDWLHNIDVELDTISTTDTETVVWCTNETNNNTTCHRGYSEFGTERGYPDGLRILFPSKGMRDWSKFTWKKGDVLYSAGLKEYCVFNKFISDGYLMFISNYNVDENTKRVVPKTYDTDKNTVNYEKVSDEKATEIISLIEEHYGGKLNLSTLEIEKQPEFKDGDIVFMKGIKGGYYANCIFILRSEYKDGDERAFYYAFYNTDDKFTIAEYGNTRVHYSLRPATDSEKQQLFDALAKKGKTWDAEKKMIVNLKPKVELKPFDNVLVRHQKTEEWRANIFSHTDKTDEYLDYVCVNGRWEFCIPYEGNESLLGTTKDVEG